MGNAQVKATTTKDNAYIISGGIGPASSANQENTVFNHIRGGVDEDFNAADPAYNVTQNAGGGSAVEDRTTVHYNAPDGTTIVVHLSMDVKLADCEVHGIAIGG